MPQQFQLEGRAPRCICLQRTAGDGANRPARGGGTGGSLGLDPQQQRGHARRFRRQLEAACGGQAKVARIPPQLDHRHANAGATQHIRARPQNGVGIGQNAQQQARRGQAQLGESLRVQTQTTIGPLLAQPHELSPQPVAPYGCNGRCTGGVAPGRREDFVQLRPRQPATQGFVNMVVPGGNPRLLRRHAPLPRTGKLAQPTNLVAVKPHLFTLCSYRGATPIVSTIRGEAIRDTSSAKRSERPAVRDRVKPAFRAGKPDQGSRSAPAERTSAMVGQPLTAIIRSASARIERSTCAAPSSPASASP